MVAGEEAISIQTESKSDNLVPQRNLPTLPYQGESPFSSRDNDSPQVVHVTNPHPTPIEHAATAGELLFE